MRDLLEALVDSAAGHPIIAVILSIYFGIALIVGTSHETRYFGECLIVGIRFLKREMFAWHEYLRRLKREVTTRKSDP